jgi:uncharacterized protein
LTVPCCQSKLCEAFAQGDSGDGAQVRGLQGQGGEFRFRFKASNGEIMFGSEGYKAKKSALDAIESIKKNAPAAAVDDQAK